MQKIIVVSEDGMFTSGPIAVTEMADLFCAALTSAVQQVQGLYKDEEDAPKIDQELFDCMNHSFSKCLENAFPGICLRPDITEEAIMELENKIAAERVQDDNIIPITAVKKEK